MIQKYQILVVILVFMGSSFSVYAARITEDFDPLVDLEVTVDIISLRFFDDVNFSNSSGFYVNVFINSEKFSSPVWNDSDTLYNIHWTATQNVPDDVELVDIKIELCDYALDTTRMKPQYSSYVYYSLKTGHWSGDDAVGDPSGYGRLNSQDAQRKNNQSGRGYELWFDIHQTDYDGDTLPYWTERYMYGTDPQINNTGDDADADMLPIEWEHKWMYNPLMPDNHTRLDPDADSLTNIEEYRISAWDSDPYRRDLFLELDIMGEGPQGQNSSVPVRVKERLKSAFDQHNIVLHLDDGCMGGGETLPFDTDTFRYELRTIYAWYFLHNDSENWRRSVFHYGIVVFHQHVAAGIAYVGDHPWLYWHTQGINTFVISAESMQKTAQKTAKPVDFIFACAMMHETGHTFGIDFLFPAGCDNVRTTHPLSIAYWLFANYRSCMNYRYVYSILDYSDGSHGLFDNDDWSALNFAFFEKSY
jgi:hypothetical protein